MIMLYHQIGMVIVCEVLMILMSDEFEMETLLCFEIYLKFLLETEPLIEQVMLHQVIFLLRSGESYYDESFL
jgi:hypothetical protein